MDRIGVNEVLMYVSVRSISQGYNKNKLCVVKWLK